MKRKISTLVLLFLITLVITGCKSKDLLSSHENTTGSKKYKGSDVAYNCVIKDSKKGNTNIDVLFNYDNYANVTYYKKMKKNVSDYDFSTFMKMLLPKCREVACVEKYYELGKTTFGEETAVRRQGNNLIVTSKVVEGKNKKLTKAEQDKFIKELKKDGAECK